MPSPIPIHASLPGISASLSRHLTRRTRSHGPAEACHRSCHRAGVHILTANGNTGEFYGLTTVEAVRMVNAAAELIDAACRCSPASAAASAMRWSWPRRPRRRGRRPDGAPAPDPFVAPRVWLPMSSASPMRPGPAVVLYLRNDGIGFDAIEQLLPHPRVVGVKWASPTPLRLAEAIRRATLGLSGLVASPRPGRRRCAPLARAASPPADQRVPEHSMAIHTALAAGDYRRPTR